MWGGRPWTAEDIAEARLMRDRGARWTEIGAALDRSPAVVREKLEQLANREAPRLPEVNRAQQSIVIPARVLADRDHRATLQHDSLTAWFFGDPLPGYRALDPVSEGAQRR